MIKKLFIIFILLYNLSFGATYGELLFNGNCITCHHTTKSISAPSIEIVVLRYKEAFPKKEEFISYMSEWVLKPKEETSIMHDMIAKYKLMPELGYDKESLKIIAEYLYEMKN